MPDIDQDALWRRWKDDKDDQAFDELLTSLDPLIQYNLNKWATNPVNKTALRAKAYSLVRDSLGNYDSSKGGMSTHVTNSLLPLNRYVTTYQNPILIPERLSQQIGDVQRSTTDLQETLGRKPTVDEIAHHSKIDADKVERIQGGMATSVPISQILDEADESAQTWHAMNRVADRNIHFLRAELTGVERKVFDYIQREAEKRHGAKVPVSEIAAKFKIPEKDVYGYRSNWTRRLKDVGV